MIDSIPLPAHGSLVFNDAFGTTRLTLPNKVKTVRSFSAASPGHLQQIADGVVLSGVDYPSSSRILSVPALKSTSLRYIHSCSYGVSADGASVYRLEGYKKDDGVAMQVFRFALADVSERNMVRRARFKHGTPTAPITALSPVILGGGGQRLGSFQHVWPDGRFVKNSYQGLLSGHITESGASLDWLRPIEHDLDPSRTEVRVEGDCVWILGETLGGGVAMIVRVDAAGDVREWRFDALEAPGYHDGHVGLRTGPTTFQTFRLDAPDERATFTIPPADLVLEGGVEPDTLRNGNPLPRSAAPDERGRVMMLSGTLLYLPWHGESILNVAETSDKARRISRKLPAKEFDLRSFFSRYSARLRAAGYALGGSVQPSRVWLKAKQKLTIRHSSAQLGEGFGTLCLAGVMWNSQKSYRLKAFGSLTSTLYASSTVTTEAPATVDEVRAGLDILAAHGLAPFDMVGPIAKHLEEGSIDTLLTAEARPVLAQAIRDSHASLGPEAPAPYSFQEDDPLTFVLDALG
ncbi:MAG: hypothetical protein ACI8S6_003279 [Myxococcota bacterium]|jgi:hypothetical protein